MDDRFQSQRQIPLDPLSTTQEALHHDTDFEAEMEALYFPSFFYFSGQDSIQLGLPAPDVSPPRYVSGNGFEYSPATPFNFDIHPMYTTDAVGVEQTTFQAEFPLNPTLQHSPVPAAARPILVASNPLAGFTALNHGFAPHETVDSSFQGALRSSLESFTQSISHATSIVPHQTTAIDTEIRSPDWPSHIAHCCTEGNISLPLEAQTQLYGHCQCNEPGFGGLTSSYDGSLCYNTNTPRSSDWQNPHRPTNSQGAHVNESTQPRSSQGQVLPQPVVSKSAVSRPPIKDIKASFTLHSGLSKFHTSRVRKRFPEDQRKEVAATRQVGACFRCRMSKSKCRQSPVSALCQSCFSGVGPPHTLCFRLDLSDCRFYRTSSAIQSTSLRSGIDWTTSAKVTLTLTMASVPGAPSLYIDCREFRPAESDMVADWVRGEDIGAVVKIPTYAAIDLVAVRKEVISKARVFGKAFVDVMEAEGSSPLVVRIIRGAIAYAEEHPKSLVNAALDVWACSRMCARDRSLDGEETLGQEKVADPSSPFYNQVPIPPMLDHQCDTVTINWMDNLAAGLIKTLWKKLSDKKKEDWFEVFLTVFIMVNNVEYVCGIAKELAYQYGINASDVGARVKRTITTWREQWAWSAKRLLFVYQAFFKTGYPFSNQALVDAATRLNPDGPTRSLIDYLLRLRVESHADRKLHLPNSEDPIQADDATDSFVYKDNGPKGEDDFDYELCWGHELFKKSQP